MKFTIFPRAGAARFIFDRLNVVAMVGACAWTMTAAAAPLSILINPGDAGEQSRQANAMALRAQMEPVLRDAKLGDMGWEISIDATADLASTRSQLHDIILAPSHVVGSAVRHKYVPLLGDAEGVQAVLVAPKNSRLENLATAKGKRMGLPLQDSVVTYLIRGELNAANSSLKSHFSRVMNMRYQDALLICLQMRECDVVGVERAVYDRWVAAGEPVKKIMETRTAPGLSVAVKPGLVNESGVRSLQTSLLKALQDKSVAKTGLGKPTAIEKSDFTYVATLGYFTPRQLPGAKVVEASGVAQLMNSGAIYIDTRTDVEFKAGHVPGAKLVPYVEKSPKDTDYDASKDTFDLSQLPTDLAAPLIFACNGAECWKSYKASHAAIKAGYSQVHWFRGGFPEWREQKMPIEQSAP